MSLSGAQGWESELQVCEDVQHGRVRRHLGRSPRELPQVTLTKNWYDQTKYHRYMLQNFFKHIDIDPKVKWDFCDCNTPFLERARSGRQRSWFSRGVCWLRAEDYWGEVSFLLVISTSRRMNFAFQLNTRLVGLSCSLEALDQTVTSLSTNQDLHLFQELGLVAHTIDEMFLQRKCIKEYLRTSPNTLILYSGEDVSTGHNYCQRSLFRRERRPRSKAGSVSCLKVNDVILTTSSLQGITDGGWQRKKHETHNLQKRKDRTTFRQALTVGVGTVMDAKEVLVLITGANKAFALYKVYF